MRPGAARRYIRREGVTLQAATLAPSLYHIYARRMGNGGWQAVDFMHAVLSQMFCR